jgi:hypothetical protein
MEEGEVLSGALCSWQIALLLHGIGCQRYDIAGTVWSRTSGQDDLTSFRFRIIGHATIVVPDHRPIGVRIGWRPV